MTSYGYNGSKRFANYVSSKPLPAVKRDVTFRKTKESAPMSTLGKVALSMSKRAAGEYSATDLAFMHKAWALEMFPLAKNGDVALAKFYETETGKIALTDAVKCEAAELQEAARIGDADQFIAKTEKDDAGDITGGPKVRHAHPKRRKEAATPTPTNTYTGESYHADSIRHEPNRQLNWPENVVGSKFAAYADSVAKAHSAAHGISLDAAYAELLANDAAFKLVFDAAKTLPAE
jgi:hypothetical protein